MGASIQSMTIYQLKTAIQREMYDALCAKARCERHRLKAGLMLVELRRRVEAGEAGQGRRGMVAVV
jgi:hypothetical protein